MRESVNILTLAGKITSRLSSLWVAGIATADKSSTAYYEDSINKLIRIYLLKKHLYKDSQLEHIRKSADLVMKKAAFLGINRDRLIAEMTEQKVEKKHYQMQAYLNKKFHESLRKKPPGQSPHDNQ